MAQETKQEREMREKRLASLQSAVRSGVMSADWALTLAGRALTGIALSDLLTNLLSEAVQLPLPLREMEAPLNYPYMTAASGLTNIAEQLKTPPHSLQCSIACMAMIEALAAYVEEVAALHGEMAELVSAG